MKPPVNSMKIDAMVAEYYFWMHLSQNYEYIWFFVTVFFTYDLLFHYWFQVEGGHYDGHGTRKIFHQQFPFIFFLHFSFSAYFGSLFWPYQYLALISWSVKAINVTTKIRQWSLSRRMIMIGSSRSRLLLFASSIIWTQIEREFLDKSTWKLFTVQLDVVQPWKCVFYK